MKRTLTITVFFLASIVFGQEFNRENLLKIASERSAYFQRQQELIDSLSRYGQVEKTVQLSDGRVAQLKYIENGMPYYVATLNDQARTTTRVDEVAELGYDLQGEGIKVGVWDGGLVLDNHVEFERRVLNIIASDLSNHATHVTGTIGASGVNPDAQGMAPKATIEAYYAFQNDTGPMAEAAANGLGLSNHSYGLVVGWNYDPQTQGWDWFGGNGDVDQRFGFYNSNESRTLDDIAYNAPNYTIVWAAGNDRNDVGDGSRPGDGPYDCIGPEGAAKNIIVVGAIEGFGDYNSPSDAVMSEFSSWGPVDDGRIRPDIVGDGVSVLSTSAQGEDLYYRSSGTSMASPNVTGSLALVQEMYKRKYGELPTSAMLRALAIHTASEAGAQAGPDYQYGWGVMDAASAVKVVDEVNGKDTLLVLGEIRNGTADTFELTSQELLTATLVWTDPPAQVTEMGSTDLKLVNDLDLRIVSSNGEVSYPWILDPANPGKAASRADNFRDNVEKIEVIEPKPKSYQVIVQHKNNISNTRQRYALVVTGSRIDNESQTVFWVGGANSGDQNQMMASLTSGGSRDVAINNDSITLIFDNNSGFAEGDVLSFGRDIQVNNLIWDVDQPVTFDLNGYDLIVNNALDLNTDNLAVINGDLILNPAPNGSLEVSGNLSVTGGRILLTSGGQVDLKGIIRADRIDVQQGRLQANDTELFFDHLSVEEAGAISFSGNSIGASDGAVSILSEGNTLTGNRWNIDNIAFSAMQLVADDSVVLSGEVDFSGNVAIRGAFNQGLLRVTDSLSIGNLAFEAGSELVLSNSVLIVAQEIDIQSTESNQTSLRGDENSIFTISFRDRLCFDFLNIEDLNVVTSSVFNAGLNSSISNSSESILSVDCEDLLLASFRLNARCAQSLLRLVDRSRGNVDSVSAQVVEGLGSVVRFQDELFVIFDSVGQSMLKYKVSNEQLSDSTTQSLNLVENDLNIISLVENGDRLVASLQNPSYVWFRDGVEMDFDQRILSTPPAGTYRVAYLVEDATEEGCASRVSPPFTIEKVTEASLNEAEIIGFPNPAFKSFTVQADLPIQSVRFKDVTGSNLMTVHNIMQLSASLDLEKFKSGIYFVEVILVDNKRKIIKLYKP